MVEKAKEAVEKESILLKDMPEMSFEERCHYIISQRTEGGNWDLGALMKPTLHACDGEQMTTEICFFVQPWQLNPRAELHGGLLSTFFDMAMGMTAYCASGRWQCTTTDLTVSFLRPLREGTLVCIQSKVEKAGRNMIFISGHALDMDRGKIAGTAHGTFMVLSGVSNVL